VFHEPLTGVIPADRMRLRHVRFGSLADMGVPFD